MNSNYQIWDDGEMFPPVPADSKFTAERRSDGWWQVTATVNGQPRDYGKVNGARVSSAEEAIEAAKRDACRK